MVKNQVDNGQCMMNNSWFKLIMMMVENQLIII